MIDPMTKMWISFVGIGLMAIAAVIVTLAREKTKGIVKFLLTTVAFLCLIIGIILGLLSII